VDAILQGERDGKQLAGLRQGGVKASEREIIAALQGDYRAEHLFTLRQSLESYRHYQKLIGECDQRLRQGLDEFDSKPGGPPAAPSAQKKRRTKQDEELRQQYYRILGVDLTAVPSINVGTVQTFVAEVGPDLSRFRSASAWASWLGLCPDNQISGGKILSSRTRKVDNRLAAALRMAAESLCRDKSYLGQYYRRMRARRTASDYHRGPQARADHLPPGHHRRGIQRRTLRAHRSQEWREIPAAVGATGSQIGLHPGPGNPHRGGGCFLGGVK
jgi:hypothetical protein